MKLRAIINGVSFYTTTTANKQRRVGDFSLQNDALHYALDLMAFRFGKLEDDVMHFSKPKAA